MIVTVNDIQHKIPTTLADITLGQRIAFHNQYSQEIKEIFESITAMEDGIIKELEWAVFQMKIACMQFAFFTGISLEVVENSQALPAIMDVFHVTNALLAEDAENNTGKDRFEWNGEVWELHPPTLSTSSTLTFGELIDSKQIIHDLHSIGAGRWEEMKRLCAIYLRKSGEDYNKSFGDPDSDRVKLMESLPLDIALAVGFFLTSSMNFLQRLLVASEEAPSSPAEIQ